MTLHFWHDGIVEATVGLCEDLVCVVQVRAVNEARRSGACRRRWSWPTDDDVPASRLSMKIVHTADLHYGLHPDGDASTKALAQRVCREGGDALTIGGDLAIRSPAKLRECLELFSRFPGKRMFVAGNHDLWCPPYDPMTRYTKILPEIGRECGFHSLDQAPVFVGDVAFVGTVGWYDYGFRDSSLGVDEGCYERGVWPGVASWNDRAWMPWSLKDSDFVQRCLDALGKQLGEVSEKARMIVACLHHLPFDELVPRKPDDQVRAFSNAFMGSPRFGALLRAESKVKYVLCGHSHSRVEVEIDQLRAISSGSDYHEKQLETLEI